MIEPSRHDVGVLPALGRHARKLELVHWLAFGIKDKGILNEPRCLEKGLAVPRLPPGQHRCLAGSTPPQQAGGKNKKQTRKPQKKAEKRNFFHQKFISGNISAFELAASEKWPPSTKTRFSHFLSQERAKYQK